MKKRLVWLVLGVLGVVLFFCCSVLANDTIGTAWNVSLNSVRAESINSYTDKIDWYRVEVPNAGGMIVFAESSDFENYGVDLVMYYKYPNTGEIREVARDPDPIKLKNVGGACRAGTYYIKVEARYTSTRAVNYKLGVGFTENHRYCTEGDPKLYNLEIARNAITWILLVDDSSSFDPDLLIFENSRVVGGSFETGNFDHMRWELVGGTGTESFTCAVGSTRGSGYYWLFILTYHLN